MSTDIITAQHPLSAGTPSNVVTPTTAWESPAAASWLYSPIGAISTPSRGWRINLTPAVAQGNIFAMQLHATSGTAKTGRFRVYGVRAAGSGEKAIFLGEFEFRTGAATGTGGILSGVATYNFVDKFTVVQDATNSPPGVRFLGDVDDQAAEFQFDSQGYSALIILAVQAGANPVATLGLLWTVL